MTEKTDVLIVGAGPTGLTLACELARRGAPFRLVEASAGPQRGSRGKGVQPRTLEVFESLDIAERVIGHGRFAMPMHSTGPEGTLTRGGGEPEDLKGRPDVPYTTSLLTPQWRVEEALRARLAELGGRVEFGTEVTGLDPADDHVTATLAAADGAAGTIEASWVVGCDGGHSLARRSAGIAFEGETREEVRMLIADLAADGLERDAWRIWRHPEGMAALCPLPSTDLFQLQASIAPGQDSTPDLATLQAILDRRSGRGDVRLHEPEWTTLWRANVRLAARYREGRMLLAGDAAHAHSPAGGQGMNTGIQDAHNLGWKLAAVVSGVAESTLLDSYEEERRPVAADVLRLSDARLDTALREGGISPRRDASTTQLGVTYRGSSLCHDDRTDGTALRAGDRAPDATRLRTVDGERRLFNLLRGDGFTLLDFGADAAGSDSPVPTLTVVEHPTGPDQVADTNGSLAAAYGAGEHTLVLVRPDGYIATISDAGDPAAVSAALGRAGTAGTASGARRARVERRVG